MIRLVYNVFVVLGLLVACTPPPQEPLPTLVSDADAKILATVAMSSTPNEEERAATLAVITPTPRPPTATPVLTATPYLGVFIGAAQRDGGLQRINEPLFAPLALLAEPTRNPTFCIIDIAEPYVQTWTDNPLVNRRIGCPIQQGFGFIGQIQLFERGAMYHYPQINAVWAVLTGAGPDRFEYLENPALGALPGPAPSPDLLLPQDVFAAMWTAVPDLVERIGYARTSPQEVAVGIQRFENGTIFHDQTSGSIFVFLPDGAVLGPFNPPGDV